jgi:hypothetical protein
MKEHMFFIEAAFTPQNFGMLEQASHLKERASNLLSKVVSIANNNVSADSVNSSDFVTKYTLNAENATAYYTKLPFDTNITQREYELTPIITQFSNVTINDITILNNEAHQIVSDIISFKTSLLDQILKCSIFTMNYPLLIDHILREAKYYLKKIEDLQNINQMMSSQDLIKEEIFWNRIMAEHSKFIRGLLDPTEEQLFDKTNMFANEFDELTKEAIRANDNMYELIGVTNKSIDEVIKIRDFKEQGTIGLLDCKIKSIILPLLADHVLREANHYFKLLKQYKGQ